jgi:hypothetical protein
MKKRLLFYLFVAALVVLDSVLLRSPNLLGKIGLIIYRYHYLRTFPKTLLTVSIVILTAVVLSELIRWLVRLKSIKQLVGVLFLVLLILASVAILFKTGLDFSTWTYSHTGNRFKYGAYLLPFILIVVFGYNLFTIRPRGEEIQTPGNDNLEPRASSAEDSH